MAGDHAPPGLLVEQGALLVDVLVDAADLVLDGGQLFLGRVDVVHAVAVLVDHGGLVELVDALLVT